MNKPTGKQLNYIMAIESARIWGIKPFTGKTKEEASAWLNKNVPIYKEWNHEITEMNKMNFYTNWEAESLNG